MRLRLVDFDGEDVMEPPHYINVVVKNMRPQVSVSRVEAPSYLSEPNRSVEPTYLRWLRRPKRVERMKFTPTSEIQPTQSVTIEPINYNH
jgi:hypothetical protein